MNKCTQLWTNCLTIIRDNVTEDQFNTWFGKIVPVSFTGRELILEVPSQFFYEYIEEWFADIIRASINRVIGPNIQLLYKISIVQSQPQNDIIVPNQNGARPADNADFDSNLNFKYTFNNFIEGESNKLARCAGLNISQNPGNSIFNPIFIYGAPAVGKTHLATAIGLAIRQRFTKKRVLYVSTHTFWMQYGDSVAHSKTNDFINFYQSIDVLIIDDIQELIGKDKIQNVFFHIFSHLIHIGKQIIICSDREPGKLEGMEERLLTRFKMGLTVEIERPEYELRKKILEHKVFQDGLRIPEDVLDFLAQNVRSNVRDLEGSLTSIIARSTFVNEDINLELAQKVIGAVVSTAEDTDENKMQRIYSVVCAHYKVDTDTLISKARSHTISEARQVAMYLARTKTDISLASIGSLMGKRDHTTVLYSCRNVSNLMDTNPAFAELIHKFERIVNE
ncbi:MAG: chromosomal replication initiator protein DnaA [Paludibacteraceae bacterium]|nr:chromosomal replication initiator protein DnaA [Candidatus Colousia faecequi]MCQ2337776.1 chromosomal replication initiator protein DnaA [Paludibacteraceae bacterium]